MNGCGRTSRGNVNNVSSEDSGTLEFGTQHWTLDSGEVLVQVQIRDEQRWPMDMRQGSGERQRHAVAEESGQGAQRQARSTERTKLWWIWGQCVRMP